MATLHTNIDNKKSEKVMLAVVEALSLSYKLENGKAKNSSGAFSIKASIAEIKRIRT